MRKIILLGCLIFSMAFSANVCMAQGKRTDESELLYTYSVKKTFFQNLGDWFSTWGKSMFKSSQPEEAKGKSVTPETKPDEQTGKK